MKEIRIDNEARQALKRGADFVANIVKKTLGPDGRNVAIGSQFVHPVITNDGVSIARAIELKDPIENLGVQIIREASQKTNDKAGDGTTTAITLAQAIMNAGFNKLESDDKLFVNSKKESSLDIKRQIIDAGALVISELKKMAKPVKALEDLQKVAFIAVEDKKLGDLIAEVVDKVGAEGVIKVEESDGVAVEYEITDGMEIPSGYISPYMVTNDETLESVVQRANILVTNGNIASPAELLPIIQELQKESISELVVFAENVDKNVIEICNLNRIKGGVKVLIVKPSLWNKGIFEDIATVSGATLIDVNTGMVLSKATRQMLGKVTSVVSTSDKTVITGGKGDRETAIKRLKAELKTTKAPFDKEKIEERIARIAGKVALINVGAVSNTERKYLKDKIDDAVNATQCALAEGVVAGAGLALKAVSEKLKKNIITEAILAPYNQIQENSGGLKIAESVIDPVKVTRTAVETACSVAANLLTIEAAIVDIPKKNESNTGENN